MDGLGDFVRAEREWLNLTVLRFATHPRVREALPGYLIDLWHGMRGAIGLLEAATARSRSLAAECPVSRQLSEYYQRHIEEERGHDEWLLADLERLGVDPIQAMQTLPSVQVAELLGTMHFWVLNVHPVAALSYFYVVERHPPNVALLDWMVRQRAVPRAALQTFFRHAVIDVAHGDELERLLAQLPLSLAQHELLRVSAKAAIVQLARIVEHHVRRADGFPPNERPGSDSPTSAGEPLAPLGSRAP